MKDFDNWNKLKKGLEIKEKKINFHESEIYWCHLGLNIGDEEDGKNENFERPVLVLRKFSKRLLQIIPLSTKIKEGDFYVNFETKDNLKYSILLSQTRIISSNRLIRYLNRMSRNRFILVKEKYKILMKL